MSVTFAGVPLNPCLPATAAQIEAQISMRDVIEFQQQVWPGKNRVGWTFPGYVPNQPLTVNSLWWPIGASRYATAHFVCSEARLQQISDIVYAGGGYTSQPLVFKHTQRLPDGDLAFPADVQVGDNTITTSMYLLSAHPLFQFINTPGQPLWLLTLVDDRFFWWFRDTGAITVDEGTTTWDDLYDALGTAIGESITADPIPTEYLKPNGTLSAYYERTPIMLDAVAYNVGQRIVRLLDGTILAQNPVNAQDSQNTSLALPANMQGGGLFRVALPDATDSPGILPHAVRITFPALDGPDGTLQTDPHVVDVELADIPDLPDFAGVQTNPGAIQTFHDTAVYDTTNAADLEDLTVQFATDWYRFQDSPLDLNMNGIIPWTPEAQDDSIEWTHGPSGVFTRVMRGPVNDLTEELMHLGVIVEDTVDITIVTNVCDLTA